MEPRGSGTEALTPPTNPGFFTLANTECVAAVCNRVNAADLTFIVKREVDQPEIAMSRSCMAYARIWLCSIRLRLLADEAFLSTRSPGDAARNAAGSSEARGAPQQGLSADRNARNRIGQRSAHPSTVAPTDTVGATVTAVTGVKPCSVNPACPSLLRGGICPQHLAIQIHDQSTMDVGSQHCERVADVPRVLEGDLAELRSASDHVWLIGCGNEGEP